MNNLIKQIIESKFNFNIDIEDNNIDNMQDSLSKSKYNSMSLKELYDLELYIVDLGLPSGTKWCRYNLGVNINLLNNIKDWYGSYYAWGELKLKKWYTWYNYKFGKIPYMKKYNKTDKLILLLLEDDVAYLNLHLNNYKFRIPSKELFEELLEYTNNEWGENYNDINGLNGRIFKSKTNNNKIFIPAAGFYNGSELYYDGNIVNLWSSSIYADSPYDAWYLNFGSELARMIYYDHCDRCIGMSIRPVLLKS